MSEGLIRRISSKAYLRSKVRLRKMMDEEKSVLREESSIKRILE